MTDDLKRMREDFHRFQEDGRKFEIDSQQKGRIIRKLTENGKLMVKEINRLREENQRSRMEKLELIQENNEFRRKTNIESDAIPKLESEIKVLNDQNQYLKLLTEDTATLKEQEEKLRNQEMTIQGLQALSQQYSCEIQNRDAELNSLRQTHEQLTLKVNEVDSLKSVRDEMKALSLEHERLQTYHQRVCDELEERNDQLLTETKKLNVMEEEMREAREQSEKWRATIEELRASNEEEEFLCKQLKHKLKDLQRSQQNDNNELEKQEQEIK